MKVISSAELRNNIKKYLDTARTETFVLTKQDSLPEDFARTISMDEVIPQIESGMRKIVESKRTNQK